MKKPRMTFNKGAIPFVLKAFDCELDGEGYIINSLTKEKVLSSEGVELTRDNFGGIVKSSKTGEPLFIEKGLYSAIMIAEKMY